MSKKNLRESVVHDWVSDLTFQMQALLFTAMRGPDHNNKHTPAKALVRYMRGVILKPAGDWDGTNNNDFMWGDYTHFQTYVKDFFFDHDFYPHHFILHLLHCAEVIGYKHPDEKIATSWRMFYKRGCSEFHMNCETEEQMEERLNDFGKGIHNIKCTKDPNTCQVSFCGWPYRCDE